MKQRDFRTKVLAGLLLLLTAAVSSCQKIDDNSETIKSVATKPNLEFWALSGANQLLKFNANNTSQNLGSVVTISGLQTGETIVAIDYRPATGQLYGLGITGTTGRLYVIPLTSSTTATSVTARLIGGAAFSTTLGGSTAGFDFDPTTDLIHVVTTTGQNFLLNPETAAMTSQAAISGGTTPRVTGSAYSNNVAGASSTQLYGLDVANQKLYKQDGSTGALTEVGPLGGLVLPDPATTGYSSTYVTNINNSRIGAGGGFDIAPNGTALAVFMNNAAPAIPIGAYATNVPSTAVSAVSGTATLFSIDVTSGKATDLGAFAFPANVTVSQIIGIAIPTSPVAYAINDATNNLLIFNPTSPQPVEKTISGLQTGESILGLDMRPANGQLYALTTAKRLYTINAASGAATLVSTLLTPLSITGSNFGFDFNPVTDVIKVVGDDGQSFRVSPTGAVTVDASFASTYKISGLAYSGNTAGATSSTLYVLDAGTDSLYSQASTANNGTLTKIGKLGLNVESANGFDIGGYSATAYAILTVGSETRLYPITLSTGVVVTPGVAFPYKVRGFTMGLGF